MNKLFQLFLLALALNFAACKSEPDQAKSEHEQLSDSGMVGHPSNVVDTGTKEPVKHQD